MKVKVIVDERFEDYKVPSLYLGCIQCNDKCAVEGGFSPDICINKEWRDAMVTEESDDEIIQRYLANRITSAIIFGLLEPFDQFDEMYSFINKLRNQYNCKDTVVIYTGFNKSEVLEQIKRLQAFENIIIKFGRYCPDKPRRFDEVLGVFLASDNQYAEKIS